MQVLLELNDNEELKLMTAIELEKMKREEIIALASCDKTTISNFMKSVYKINVDDPNYELF